MKVTPKILVLLIFFAIISVLLVKFQVEGQRETINLYIDHVTKQKRQKNNADKDDGQDKPSVAGTESHFLVF